MVVVVIVVVPIDDRGDGVSANLGGPRDDVEPDVTEERVRRGAFGVDVDAAVEAERHLADPDRSDLGLD